MIDVDPVNGSNDCYERGCKKLKEFAEQTTEMMQHEAG